MSVKMTERVRPSRWWYLLGILLFAGCSMTVAKGVGGLQDKVEAMYRVVVPGEVSLTLDAGEYTGYYEARSIVDGKLYSTGDTLSGLFCAMRSADSGTEVKINPSSTGSEYSLGSYVGVSIFDFQIKVKGGYLFACDYSESPKGQPVVIAIGSGITGSIMMAIIPALLLGFGGGAILIVVFLKRRKGLRAKATAT